VHLHGGNGESLPDARVPGQPLRPRITTDHGKKAGEILGTGAITSTRGTDGLIREQRRGDAGRLFKGLLLSRKGKR